MKLSNRYEVLSFRPEGDRYLSVSLRDMTTGHELALISITPAELAGWVQHREPTTDRKEIRDKIIHMIAAGPGSL